MGWEIATAIVIILLGVGAFVPLRAIVHRLRLTTAYMVFVVAVSVYLAVAVLDPKRIADPTDSITWWLNRAVVGALLFVAVRVIDRLAVVPMFTRGGTAQVPRFIHQVVLIVLSIFVVLMYGKAAFGWPISDFLTGGAVVSIVIGLALQESLGNLFSGLMLQAAPPFVLGDWISFGSWEGRVVDMTWRAVTLHTIDDNYVVIPNGQIAKQEIINYNAPDSTTARFVKIGLEYDLPPCDAMEALKSAAVETAGVKATPPPIVVMLDFAESAILYGIKFWISEPQRHLKVEHQVRLHAWYRLKQKGYAIPFPTRVVEHISQPDRAKHQLDVELVQKQQTLAKVPLLEPLSEQQHEELAQVAELLRLAPGQILFRQDDAGDSLYVIRKGKAEILVRGNSGGESLVATLEAGEVFGEMSALTGQPRTATVRAGSPLTLVVIDKGDLQRLIDSDPKVLEKISEMIVRRNVHRDEYLKNAAAATENNAAVISQQQSLLGKMMSFFGKKA